MERLLFVLSKDGNTVMTKCPKKAVRLIKEYGYTVTKRLFGETEYFSYRIEESQMIDTVNAFLKKEYGTYVEASSLCIDLMVGPRESSAVIGTDTFIYLTTCDKQKVARLKDLMRMLQIKQDDNYIVDICSAM